ncbi:acyltransferase family protein [Caviibacterium pharyngocola]|uniref:Acyltransferase n=1 Tax=Caviibacterium pharyngocola TaxID=28159 RepID=A0A2M8RST9_9PAST|nr:acyltransferase family protein [Caviibacterium pharyngocola]PJG81953.1 acyltransferase [Caviibacterium pharyngocola]
MDGLRALAVLSIFIYHLNDNWLPGGFLGVDIFFVISGYLITKIIITEMTLGHFSFLNFYNRRIKRIYPVFILTLFIASIFASLVFIRSESELLRRTIELATIFVSNFYLSHRQGYFDLSTSENPLLHIWSLAVEEQYYLFFPIILYFIYRKIQKIKSFTWVICILFLFFIFTSFLPEKIYHKIGLFDIYYLSNLRFPELLVGSFLATLPKSNLSKRKNSLLSLFSFLGILISLFFYSKNFPFLPGISLLIPCVLTGLFIFSSTMSNPIKSFLSLSPIVFIGKISYSLYLFHWLFIAFAHYITGQSVFEIKIVLIVLSLTFTCSILSYYLLENPIRKSKLSFKKSFIILYLIPSLLVIAYNMSWRKTIKNRTEQYKVVPNLVLNDNNYPAKIAVLGDSHSEHLNEFLQVVGNKEGWKADILDFQLHCYFPDRNNKPTCNTSPAELVKDYPIVFISMFYNVRRGVNPVPRVTPERFIVDNFEQRFVSFVRELAQTKQVYVFADVRMVNRSPFRSIFLDKIWLGKYLVPLAEMGETEKNNNEIYQMIQAIPRVKWIDPTPYITDKYFVEGKPLYADQDHLTNFGSYYMGQEFIKHQRLLSEKEVKALYP